MQDEQGARRSRRVAIIGAGAAGLVAARELRAEGHSVVVLEQQDAPCGVWRYTAATEEADPLGLDPGRPRVHSSMYRHLRTNLPRQVMAYLDFPFEPSLLGRSDAADPRTFPGHAEVLRYLEAYAAHHALGPLLRGGVRVVGVEPMLRSSSRSSSNSSSRPHVPSGAPHAPPAAAGRSGGAEGCGAGAEHSGGSGDSGGWVAGGEDDVCWRVTSERRASHGQASTRDGSGGVVVEEELYDAVVVANGHYSEPRLPDVAGLTDGTFPGQQLHAHSYRTPEPWRGQVVLVVGASNSGEDVSRELSAGGAERVLLSARSWQLPGWGGDEAPYGPGRNIYRRPMLSALLPDGRVRYEGGREEGPVHAVIYCTGYRYSFPFLRGAAASAVAVDDNRVGPLWLHLAPAAAVDAAELRRADAAGGGAAAGGSDGDGGGGARRRVLLAPGLSFLGLPWKVVPFPQFQLQARLVARLLSGRVALPPAEAMAAEVAAREAAAAARGMPKRYAHMQGADQFAYNDALASLCGPDTPPLPGWRQVLYAAAGAVKRQRPEDYRDADLGVYGGEGVAEALAEAEAESAALVARIRAQAAEAQVAVGAAAP